jgi:hypothetical protein
MSATDLLWLLEMLGPVTLATLVGVRMRSSVLGVALGLGLVCIGLILFTCASG